MDQITKDHQNLHFQFLIFETQQFINFTHCRHIKLVYLLRKQEVHILKVL